MIETRVEEQTVVDVERRDSMTFGGCRIRGERSDPERKQPPRPTARVVHAEGIERPDPEVPPKPQQRM